MPLIANNIVVTSSTGDEKSVAVEPTSRYVTPPLHLDPNHAHVVVNNQAKKLGRTSQYLLDMLSSDKL